MSSSTMRESGDLYASSKILAIAYTLAKSVYPTKFSGETILTKGKPLSIAILAAKAVFPEPFSPSRRSESSRRQGGHDIMG